MQAIRVTAFGGPEVLTLADVERPVAGNGEVLVRVAAAGLNYMGRPRSPGDLEAVRPRGHSVIYGAASGRAEPISPNSLSARALTVSGASLSNFIATREELLRRAADLFDGLRETPA